MPRPVHELPKAHLHLHFTGSMRHSTLLDLAARHRLTMPDSLVASWPPQLQATDVRGWFRFQRLYDIARGGVRGEADMRRVVREAAEDDAAEGSRWLEIQVDPTSYAPFVGGLTPALEIVLDEAALSTEATGTGVAVIVAASRIRHPLDARTLARLAVRYAGSGPGRVVGFGLSNDERRGEIADFAPAFAIARRAGLALVPHSGELLGPASIDETLRVLRPDRLGHGVRSAEDPAVLERIVASETVLEVCPGSNVSLGVYSSGRDVPLPTLMAAGATIALGADDPLLFGTRLADQYQLARDALGLSDADLAQLASGSVRGSLAPDGVKRELLDGIQSWLSADPPAVEG